MSFNLGMLFFLLQLCKVLQIDIFERLHFWDEKPKVDCNTFLNILLDIHLTFFYCNTTAKHHEENILDKTVFIFYFS
jgi:hypothetical protein